MLISWEHMAWTTTTEHKSDQTLPWLQAGSVERKLNFKSKVKLVVQQNSLVAALSTVCKETGLRGAALFMI